MADLFHQLLDALSDRYHLEAELGRGGMATIYLARDPRLKRLVAIKVLHPELANIVGQERFLQEIRFASELNHPHILPLLDSGSARIDQGELPYYVMPYVEGETLRTRLVREKQLPLPEALSIAHDVATALAYAHAHGVIHRDIKPENILLTGSEAVVADFGIARAIDRSSDPAVVTSAGLVVGTPAYMSPEQASAESALDGRTDIYSLGCVLYEMLGGDPPFSGTSINAILARHRADPVPSLRTIRPTVSPAVELAVMHALQKVPADRYASAQRFADALKELLSPRPTPVSHVAQKPSRRSRAFKPLLALVLVAAVALTVTYLPGSRAKACDGSAGGCGLDTTRYAILSIEQEPGLPPRLNPTQLLQDALARWSGVSLVDPFQVRDALSRKNTGQFQGKDWQTAAKALGAGRYIRGEMTRVSNLIRVHAVVYDTRRNVVLAEQSVRIGDDGSTSDSAYAELADRLLFRDAVSLPQPAAASGTRSAPARQAFTDGYDAVTAWNLARADTAFAQATHYDPEYSQAFLWLALIRMWSDEDPTTWASAAERAARGRERLSVRDRAISDAVLAQSRGDAMDACRRWERLAVTSAYDFVAWYGWGDCLRQDDAVVPNRRSPTGWQYRSSYHQAFKSYRRAFQLLPSVHRSFRTESFASVRRLLEPGFNDLRAGKALLPDTTTFVAPLSWEGDSLVLFPIPAWKVAQGQSTVTSTTGEAVRHQRQLFHEIATGWVSAFPGSAEALETLAFSLDVLGDRSALDTLRLAALYARDPEEKLRVRIAEVWMTLKFSLPSNVSGLRSSKRLVDSLLDENPSPNSPQAEQLAALAALTGRAARTAMLSQSAATRISWEVPVGLAGSAPGMLVYASLGGPSDSIRVYERRVRDDIARNLTAPLREEARAQWLSFPVTLAFPAYHPDSMGDLVGTGDLLLDAQAAFVRGDTAAVVKSLRTTKEKRAGIDPAELSLDALYLEAYLWAALGHQQIAADWLDPSLKALPGTGSRLLSIVFRAGPLTRAMALRAHLADQLGDHETARRWATAVSILWADADPFLRPELAQMQQITSAGSRR
ncbi:MAG: protein kinase [Gemmatimonadota bacterium]